MTVWWIWIVSDSVVDLESKWQCFRFGGWSLRQVWFGSGFPQLSVRWEWGSATTCALLSWHRSTQREVSSSSYRTNKQHVYHRAQKMANRENCTWSTSTSKNHSLNRVNWHCKWMLMISHTLCVQQALILPFGDGVAGVSCMVIYTWTNQQCIHLVGSQSEVNVLCQNRHSLPDFKLSCLNVFCW